MPRNTRDWSRRKLDEAVTNITWTGYHLHQVTEIYRAAHPEISEPLEQVKIVLITCIETIEAVKRSY